MKSIVVAKKVTFFPISSVDRSSRSIDLTPSACPFFAFCPFPSAGPFCSWKEIFLDRFIRPFYPSISCLNLTRKLWFMIRTLDNRRSIITHDFEGKLQKIQTNERTLSKSEDYQRSAIYLCHCPAGIR